MNEQSVIFSQRSVIFISGAGQGYGRCCAESAACFFSEESVLVLCGRHLASLEETASLVRLRRPTMKVEIFALDLLHVDHDQLSTTLARILVPAQSPWQNFLIIHNAATVGDVTKFSDELSEEEAVRAYLQVNVVGTVVTNSILLRRIREIDYDGKASIFVVNISSMAASQPFSTMSLYCTGKAAREMFFRCLAEEWTSRHSQPLWVINFSPGPMDTSMLRDITDHSANDTLRANLQSLYDSKKVLEPSYSSQKLFHDVIGRYEQIKSGSSLDIYDL